MDRRKFLAVAGATTLAGCGGQLSESDDSAPTKDNSEPTVNTETTIDAGVEERLSFGEWYTTHHDWGITITDFTLATTFYGDGRTQSGPEMPDGEQLLFVTVKLKNLSQEDRFELDPIGSPLFAAVVDGTVFESIEKFDHPDFSNGVGMDYLDRRRPGERIGGPETVESGETITRWTGHVVPRNLDSATIQIAFDGSPEKYGIRWVPSS